MQPMRKPSLSLGLWLHQDRQCSPREVFQGRNLAYCEYSWTTRGNTLLWKIISDLYKSQQFKVEKCLKYVKLNCGIK